MFLIFKDKSMRAQVLIIWFMIRWAYFLLNLICSSYQEFLESLGKGPFVFQLDWAWVHKAWVSLVWKNLSPRLNHIKKNGRRCAYFFLIYFQFIYFYWQVAAPKCCPFMVSSPSQPPPPPHPIFFTVQNCYLENWLVLVLEKSQLINQLKRESLTQQSNKEDYCQLSFHVLIEWFNQYCGNVFLCVCFGGFCYCWWALCRIFQVRINLTFIFHFKLNPTEGIRLLKALK